ncbi:helix-turn-helix transcriptional regulator [Paracoccus sp. DMF-8]|uniref:helix-turn-helix transcriptional regulator n=1 Tax=Paracoccus sp. DMF-8 TaxID=3019445 RepID=UPI0023E7B206|nr:helix-turn-helix transcriptional regulator [Paracoccus sp. DMF-8]MDF3604845.1 helix-turn-helix transcriptional regulator [Paracoccus sp. DMF-8]
MNLRSLRLERGLSQAALAERIGTTQQTVARWETGKSQVSIAQLRALAVALDSSIAAILGETGPARRPARRTAAALPDDRPFGTLTLEFPGHSRSHPIARGALDALSADLAARDPGQGGAATTTEWLVTATLDGRRIFINPLHLTTLRMLAHSDRHPIPEYLPCPVQEALCRWPQADLPDTLRRECESAIARLGDQIATQARRLAVIFADGRQDALPMNCANAAVIASLEQERAAIARACYLRLLHDDGQHHFANLDHVALIDAPLGLMREQALPGDGASPE